MSLYPDQGEPGENRNAELVCTQAHSVLRGETGVVTQDGGDFHHGSREAAAGTRTQ